jgi:hypothetical protein
METDANNDVDGKRKGFIFPFIATTALRMEKDIFKILRKTTNSIFSGLIATYAYAPPIIKV